MEHVFRIPGKWSVILPYGACSDPTVYIALTLLVLDVTSERQEDQPAQKNNQFFVFGCVSDNSSLRPPRVSPLTVVEKTLNANTVLTRYS